VGERYVEADRVLSLMPTTTTCCSKVMTA